MNLEKLFKIQAELDKRIVEKHGLQNEDLLDKKILSLQVELGELANEWRGFKFWKINQLPVTLKEVFCAECGGTGTPFGIPEEAGVDCSKCEGAGSYYTNPLLEEYVDCLHFILSIGLEINREKPNLEKYKYNAGSITGQFQYIFHSISQIHQYITIGESRYMVQAEYDCAFGEFVVLGEMLGFTWEQIEEAYLTKNKINHERQENGY